MVCIGIGVLLQDNGHHTLGPVFIVVGSILLFLQALAAVAAAS